MLLEQFGRRFEAQTGAEAVKTLLTELDLEKEIKILRQKFKTSTKQKRERIIRRLEVLEAFNNSDNKPEWMVMEDVYKRQVCIWCRTHASRVINS